MHTIVLSLLAGDRILAKKFRMGSSGQVSSAQLSAMLGLHVSWRPHGACGDAEPHWSLQPGADSVRASSANGDKAQDKVRIQCPCTTLH